MEKWPDLEWVEAQKILISTDLIVATKKHLQFLKAVDDNGKLYDGHVLEKAVLRYKYCWLPLLENHMESNIKEVQLVVPLDCEWIWHCHRLNPVRYMADCTELFGKILDPCVVISSVQGTSSKQTEELWNKMYPHEPYELNCFNNDTSNRSTTISSTNYDLLSAVKRQRSFYYQVSRTFMKNDIFLEEAVKRYKGFLHMIRRNMETKSKDFCVPTYDIDLIWHTHQLHPISYRNDTMSLLKKVLNHDDMSSDRTKGQKLDVGFTKTTKQWNDMFFSRYWRAGAMYRGKAPADSLKYYNKLTQQLQIVFVEIMVEVIEVKTLSTNHKGNLVLSIAKRPHDMLPNGTRRFNVCSKAKETQVVSFQCEPNGELCLELMDDSWKSLGTSLILFSDMGSKLETRKSLEFESVTLDIVISTTPPSPMQYMVTKSGTCDGSDDSDTYTEPSVWATGGMCSGTGGCGSSCGGGGGCTASCGGCRASCGGKCGSGGGNCSSR